MFALAADPEGSKPPPPPREAVLRLWPTATEAMSLTPGPTHNSHPLLAMCVACCCCQVVVHLSPTVTTPTPPLCPRSVCQTLRQSHPPRLDSKLCWSLGGCLPHTIIAYSTMLRMTFLLLLLLLLLLVAFQVVVHVSPTTAGLGGSNPPSHPHDCIPDVFAKL